MKFRQVKSFSKRAKPKDGFTLVEILVVIAVLGLLAAIAIPQFIRYRSEAIDAEMKSDLRNASVAIEAYYAKQSVLPASRLSGGAVEQLLGLALQLEPRILVGLLAGDGGDARDEVEDRFRRSAFLGQDGLDDLAGLGLREPPFA